MKKLFRLLGALLLACSFVYALPHVCVTDTPYAGCIHFGMRTDSAFYSNYTQSPTQATKDFLNSHFYRMQVSFGFFENNLSWYPNAWAYINSYGLNYGDSIVSTHPEYVMHDVNGNMLYVAFACTGTPTVLGHCARYAGDFTNAGFRSYWIGQHLAILQRGYKGVWMDDVNLDIDTAIPNNNISGTTTPPVDPATHAAMTQAAWQSYFAAFLTQYNATIAAAGFDINENAVWYEGGRPAGVPATTQQAIAATNHWTNIERGVTDGGLTGGSGDFSLRAVFAYADQVHSQGRNVELQNYTFNQAGGNNDYVPACYFLISSGLDLMGNDAITPNNWPANYDVDLGTPSGARYNFGTGGIRRDFTRGFVVVTPPGTADTTFTLTAGQYTDTAGNPLTSVDIPANSGLIALAVSAPTVTPTLAASPSAWTFGSTTVGQTSGAGTLGVTISGASTTFTSVTLAGTNAGDFAISSNTCTGTIAAGASCNIGFTFTPTAAGSRSATLTLTDTANGSPQSYALTGTGASVTAGTLSFSNPSWTFGSHAVGTTSGTGHITATNSGSVSVNFTSVAFSGGNAGDFAITANTCTGALVVGANCTATFDFTPTAAGTRTSSLTFTDDATGSPQGLPVTGTATAPLASALSFSSTSQVFGSVIVSTTSPSATITTTNTGNATANFTSVAFTGTNPGDFSISSNTCTGALAASATCTTTFTFTPAATGGRAAALTYTDDVQGGTQQIPVSGTGVSAPTAALVFSNPSWTFGNVTVGVSTPSGTIGVTNTSGSSIAISSITFTGTNPGDFPITANSCTSSIAAGASCSVTFNFDPSDVGNRTALLTWADADLGSPQTQIISGTGVAPTVPAISFSNTSWAFGSQNVGVVTSAGTITATNNGTATTTLASVSLSGLNPGDFAITSNTCGSSIAVSASCTVSFTFTPAASGARSANLEFADNVIGSPQDIPLSGNGTAPITSTVSFSFGSWTFGSHRVGTTSGTGRTTITNTGASSINISSVAFAGANRGEFSITSNACGPTLAAGSGCQVNFNFTPTGTGNRVANLTFTDTAAGSPHQIAVNGTGTPAPSSGGIRGKGSVHGKASIH